MEIHKANLKWNGQLKERTTTDFFIFHHAEAIIADIYDIEKWHKMRGFIGVGYNYYIRKDGSIWEGRPIQMADADALGYNDNSISACFEGNFDKEQMTKEQIESGIWLLRYCRQKYPKLKALRHMDVNKTSCPGKNYNMRVINEGMNDLPPVTPMPDMQHQRNVSLVAETIGLNTPQHWIDHKDPNIKPLFQAMANYVYAQRFI